MNIEKKVIEIVCEVLGQEVEDVNLSSDLREDLDGDSIDFADVVMGLEEEFDIEVAEEAAMKIKTVGDIVEHLNSVIK